MTITNSNLNSGMWLNSEVKPGNRALPLKDGSKFGDVEIAAFRAIKVNYDIN